MSDPATITPLTLDLYLFTDGAATLTMRTTLPGTASYRATGHIIGGSQLLPTTCEPLGCAQQGRGNGLVYGGRTVDLGPGGWAEMLGWFGNDHESSGNQSHGITVCLYPNGLDRSASPRGSDHPHGCGEREPARAPQMAFQAAQMAATAVLPNIGNGITVPWSGGKGLQYLGVQALGAGPAAASVRGYGIWFRYGIR